LCFKVKLDVYVNDITQRLGKKRMLQVAMADSEMRVISEKANKFQHSHTVQKLQDHLECYGSFPCIFAHQLYTLLFFCCLVTPEYC